MIDLNGELFCDTWSTDLTNGVELLDTVFSYISAAIGYSTINTSLFSSSID